MSETITLKKGVPAEVLIENLTAKNLELHLRVENLETVIIDLEEELSCHEECANGG